MKIVTEIQSYIAEVKNCIIVLKEKLSIIKNYAVRTQSILVKMINILSFIVEYLRENSRMTDVNAVKMMKDK